MTPLEMKSFTFRQEREAGWRELEELLGRIEKRGTAVLGAEELHRLPALYRGALSSLSVARAISLDRNLVEYLESLAARAYVHVYGTKRDLGATVAAFFRRGFPALVRAHGRYLLAALALLVVGVLCGFFLTLENPDLYFSLVPAELAGDRSPLSTREELLEVLRDDGGEHGLSAFSSSLFVHNAQIGLLCFTLGVAAGVPVALLLFHNGVILGAMTAVHYRQGLSLEWWGWILPHGVTELLAVALCGAAGLALGLSWLFPGEYRRRDRLALQGRRSATLVVGVVVLFAVAGLIEGFFRQLVTADLPRYLLAVATAAGWGLYFGQLGRGER
jgi:uncharacterized membrane protein SpoIIM required for sporulation